MRPAAGVTLPDPAKWLGSLGHPFTEADLKQLGKGAWRDVFYILLRTPLEVGRAVFSFEDPEAEVSPGVSRMEWLVELGNVLEKKPMASRLDEYLTQKYGEYFFEVKKGKITELFANEFRFAASFLIEQQVEFDNSMKIFRKYDPDTGIWRIISFEWVMKVLMEYAVPLIKADPAIYLARHRFFDDVFKSCRPLGLPSEEYRFNGFAIFGVKNGVVALRSPDSVAPVAAAEAVYQAAKSPAHMVRNALPVAYDKSKTHAPKFEKFLAGMFPAADRETLQNWCGTVLLGRNMFHKILIVTGPAKTGKSTLINLIEKLIGRENTATLVTSRLEDRFELSDFFGKTLLIGKDVSSDFLNKRSAHMLKSLSGDSGIKAEVKYAQQRVCLGGPFNILMVSNADLTLDLHGDADAWARRILLLKAAKVEITHTIQDYEDVLIREEGPAILNWMLRGAREVLKLRRLGREFPQTDEQKAAVAKFLGRADPVGEFVASELTGGTAADCVTTDDLYTAYLNYCGRTGTEILDRPVFEKRLVMPIVQMCKGEHKHLPPTEERQAKWGYRSLKFRASTCADSGGPRSNRPQATAARTGTSPAAG